MLFFPKKIPIGTGVDCNITNYAYDWQGKQKDKYFATQLYKAYNICV